MHLPAPAPSVKMVKLDGSPLTPCMSPGPYAVMCPLVMESTWNLKGEPIAQCKNSNINNNTLIQF